MQASDQVAQLGDGFLRLAVRVVDHCAGLVRQVAQRGLGQAQVERECDEALLRAVVQVALDPAAFGVGGVEHAGPAVGEVGDPAGQLLLTARSQQRPGGGGVDPGQCLREPAGAVEQCHARDGDVGGFGGVAGVVDPPGRRWHPDPDVDGRRHGTDHPAEQRQRPAEHDQRTGQEVIAQLSTTRGRPQPWHDATEPRPFRQPFRPRDGDTEQAAETLPLRPAQQRSGGYRDDHGQHPGQRPRPQRERREQGPQQPHRQHAAEKDGHTRGEKRRGPPRSLKGPPHVPRQPRPDAHNATIKPQAIRAPSRCLVYSGWSFLYPGSDTCVTDSAAAAQQA